MSKTAFLVAEEKYDGFLEARDALAQLQLQLHTAHDDIRGYFSQATVATMDHPAVTTKVVNTERDSPGYQAALPARTNQDGHAFLRHSTVFPRHH
jgi:hypothetical protein